MRTFLLLVFTVLIALQLVPTAQATPPSESIYDSVHQTVDPARKHIIYLHGIIVELQGRRAVSEAYGRYYFDEILTALALRGFVVIAEVRPRNTSISAYARKVADQVRALMRKGVPPENITVAGSSKGAGITGVAAAELGQPKVNFVIMAGCPTISAAREEFIGFVNAIGPRIQGRMLSIYDEADDQAGSCQAVFNRAPLLVAREIKLQTGLGHALFFAPYREWLDLLEAWTAVR